MNRNSLTNLQIGLAEVSRLLLPLAIILLLGAVGLGWLVKSFLILLGLIILAPVLAFVGFRWWLSRNVVPSHCPVCQIEFVGLKHTEFRCPNCSEPLRAEHGKFERLTPPGTIDVSAVEVPAQQLDD